MPSDAPSISSGSEISAHDGKKVVLKGTYTQIEVRKRHPRDERPPEYTGHVAITLDDGEQVFLEPTWADASIRSEDERSRFDGQPVEVTGTLHSQQPEPEIPVAMPMGPCIAGVESIRPAG